MAADPDATLPDGPGEFEDVNDGEEGAVEVVDDELADDDDEDDEEDEEAATVATASAAALQQLPCSMWRRFAMACSSAAY